jgi:hypothetical protein
MDQVLVDESSIKALVVSAVPDFEWLIGEIESQDGWIRFPPFLTNAMPRERRWARWTMS